MATQQMLFRFRNTGVQKIGKDPVVVLPLKVWQEIQDYLEDLEIEKSRRLPKKIAAARREKSIHTAAQVKKLVGA